MRTAANIITRTTTALAAIAILVILMGAKRPDPVEDVSSHGVNEGIIHDENGDDPGGGKGEGKGDGLTAPPNDTSPTICRLDLTGDRLINVDDLVEVVVNWGPCVGFCTADLDHSGSVDVGDLIEIIVGWGACPG